MNLPPTKPLDAVVVGEPLSDFGHKLLRELLTKAGVERWHFMELAAFLGDSSPPNLPPCQGIIGLGEPLLVGLYPSAKGIEAYRGSQLFLPPPFPSLPFLPTLHPTDVIKQWETRVLLAVDLNRYGRWLKGAMPWEEPERSIFLDPTFEQVMETLDFLQSKLPLHLSFDIETIPDRGILTCAGLAWKLPEEEPTAICIPFVANGGNRWSEEEYLAIVKKLQVLLTSEGAAVVGQNLLYDFQWVRRLWGFTPRMSFDTMLAHHVLNLGMKKSLSFQASLYARHYRYWKQDHKPTKEGD